MRRSQSAQARNLPDDEALLKVREMLKHFRNTMLVTSANGFPHSRPMGLHGKAEEFDGTLWFFTDRTSRKVEEIKGNPSSSLVFQSDGDNAFMHLFGRAWMTDNGDFWDSPGGILQVLAAFTKSVVTGKQGQGGEIGEVALI